MLDRKTIFEWLEESGQKPQYLNELGTLIGTREGGVFYVLEYNGTGRRGWSIADGVLQELQAFKEVTVLLLNGQEEEAFIISGKKNKILLGLQSKTAPYKIDKCEVKECFIDHESLFHHLHELHVGPRTLPVEKWKPIKLKRKRKSSANKP